uniref:Uncharacterized protein n=1 Tax=Arundo donax TaxID=35708 RepID=A0A0A9ELL5_ARUDO
MDIPKVPFWGCLGIIFQSLYARFYHMITMYDLFYQQNYLSIRIHYLICFSHIGWLNNLGLGLLLYKPATVVWQARMNYLKCTMKLVGMVFLIYIYPDLCSI